MYGAPALASPSQADTIGRAISWHMSVVPLACKTKMAGLAIVFSPKSGKLRAMVMAWYVLQALAHTTLTPRDGGIWLQNGSAIPYPSQAH